VNTHIAKVFFAVIVSYMVAFAVTSASKPVFADDKRQCTWTQIKDFGAPNIGTNGEVALAENWQILSEDGWSLKTVNSAPTGLEQSHYIFEKCE
tara:strand:- start:168 stop:449 length:282 start_codon:yes stop_codon:yes gene_type:complete